MAAEDMETQGAKASTAMILTQFPGDQGPISLTEIS